MKSDLTKLSVTAAALLTASAAHADLTTSGLTENFDASQGTNTIARWDNLVGSTDFVRNDHPSYPLTGGITLGSVTSANYDIDTAYGFDTTVGLRADGTNVFPSQDNSNSFEIWFRTASLSSDAVLFETGGGLGASIVLTASGNVQAFAEGATLTYALSEANLGYVATTDFVQVVMTADSSNPTTGTKLYVNGDLVAQGAGAAWNGTGDQNGLGNSLQTGGDPAFTENGFSGDIAIFRVYDDILTGAEVLDNYNAVVPEPGSLALLGLGGLLIARRRRA